MLVIKVVGSTETLEHVYRKMPFLAAVDVAITVKLCHCSGTVFYAYCVWQFWEYISKIVRAVCSLYRLLRKLFKVKYRGIIQHYVYL